MATFKQLLKFIASHIFSRASFFWFVNLTFMAVSVLHAGLFFGLLEPQSGLWGVAPYLGFAVALVLDLASIVFMQARLSALRMNERGSAAWYLFSIVACSGLSAFGNLAMSLEDFKAASLSHVGGWIQGLSPWLGVAFPLLIILISIAADKMLDIDPTNKVSVEEYKVQQQRRIDILTERNNFLQQQTDLERQERAIKHPEKLAKSAHPARDFFLKKWLFPERQNVPALPETFGQTLQQMTETIMGNVAVLLMQESQKNRGDLLREISIQIAQGFDQFVSMPEQEVAHSPSYEYAQFPTMYIVPMPASEEPSYYESVGVQMERPEQSGIEEGAQPEPETETNIPAFRMPVQAKKRSARKTAQPPMQRARKTAHTLWTGDPAMSVREIARRVHKPESTVRNWIKQFADAQNHSHNGHHIDAENVAELAILAS